MAECEVILQTKAGDPISYAWVYWNKGGKLLMTDRGGLLYEFAFDGNRGQWCYKPTSVSRFCTPIGTEVEIYYSRGAKPIPQPRLQEHPDVFYKRKIQVEPADNLPRAQAKVATGDQTKKHNTLVGTPRAVVQLPDILIGLTTPAELSFWPVLWELPRDWEAAVDGPQRDERYMTDGLAQHQQWWQQALQELVIAPAPALAVRPRERALHVIGTIDPAATGVKIQVLDRNGNVVQLRQNIDPSSAHVQEVTLHPPALTPFLVGPTKRFETDIFFASAVDVFGPVQIFVQSEGKDPPIVDAFTEQLVGLQISLVDDHMSNQNGQVAGQVLGEADEVVVVDFVDSPQPAPQPGNAPLLPQTRARRMVAYQVANELRHLRPTDPASPNVLTPQMPMWMAECQLLGVKLSDLSDLMVLRALRKYRDSGPTPDFGVNQMERDLATKGLAGNFGTGWDFPGPTALWLSLEWHLDLFWNGPDSNNGQGVYHYRRTFDSWPTQRVALRFSETGELRDSAGIAIQPGANGQVPGALAPAPAIMPFPVPNRRLPQVFVSGKRRRWGRQSGATEKDALLIEFQPLITDDNYPAPDPRYEATLGGYGKVRLQKLTLNDDPIDPGRIPDAAGVLQVAAAEPIVELPKFLIRGNNPQAGDVETAIDAIVDELVDGRQPPQYIALPLTPNAQDTLTFLPRNAYKLVMRDIFQWESQSDGDQHGDRYVHFRTNSTLALRYGIPPPPRVYGKVKHMPVFGAPHGYGFAQKDPPNDAFLPEGCPGDILVWNFLVNLRCGILVYIDNVRASLEYFRAGAGGAAAAAFNNLLLRDQQAMVQRHAVRLYNGGREFRFYPAQGVWRIGHWRSFNNNALEYPNAVLRISGSTDVNYPILQPGVNPPPPVVFQPQNYGPGI